MRVTLDTTAKRDKTIKEQLLGASRLLNQITGSAEYELLRILLDEVDLIEADNQIDRSNIPNLERYKNLHGISYVQAGTRIRNRYLAIRTEVSAQLVDAYKAIEDLRG